MLAELTPSFIQIQILLQPNEDAVVPRVVRIRKLHCRLLRRAHPHLLGRGSAVVPGK